MIAVIGGTFRLFINRVNEGGTAVRDYTPFAELFCKGLSLFPEGVPLRNSNAPGGGTGIRYIFNPSFCECKIF